MWQLATYKHVDGAGRSEDCFPQLFAHFITLLSTAFQQGVILCLKKNPPGVIQAGGMDAPPRVEPPGRYEKCVETHYTTGDHLVWQLGFSRFRVADTGFQPVGEILPPA